MTQKTVGDRVRLDVESDIAHVRLIRPDKLNAIDMTMFDSLAEIAEELERRADVRVVVLSGEGRAFCAGIDLSALEGLSEQAGRQSLELRSHGWANIYQYCATAWRSLAVPVIAALQGPVFGAGLQIALGADIRLCAANTRLSVMELRWGLVPDVGATVLFGNLVRPDILRELFYTARIVEAEEALSIGLVTRIVDDPLTSALNMAREIAEHSPAALRAAKRLLNAMPFDDPASLLIAESTEQLSLIGGPDNVEAVSAFREKRAARFGTV
ncbi:crotonase/enoyl-CoA hydratase family protein [Nostoc sp. 3335mG]|nr:crotonase/enoyl-CoA hydratase family protein [Nostoc sp. 3335mG]